MPCLATHFHIMQCFVLTFSKVFINVDADDIALEKICLLNDLHVSIFAHFLVINLYLCNVVNNNVSLMI